MEYLKKADEIKVAYRDRKSIPDLAMDYPEATIILHYKGEGSREDWEEYRRYSILCKENFIVALNDLSYVEDCKYYGLKYYYAYPITSFYDLRAMKKLGCEYALIDAPITHCLEEAAAVGIPLRMVPNVAYYAFIPRDEGVCGGWFRPEDVDAYAPYIQAIEFEDCDQRKEQALYRLYMEEKAWSGDLNMVISNLNYPATNRMIPPRFAEARLTCAQACQQYSHCKLCYRYLNLADPNKIQPLLS